MNKGKLTVLLRRAGLMMAADSVKYYLYTMINYRKNRAFRSQHPEVNLPPPYMVFESFKLDYDKYYSGGKRSAEWVVGLFKKYTDVKGKVVLDWGCGPARITRHLSELMADASIFGTDYNQKTIDWCRQNIPTASFSVNEIDKPLSFEDDSFDFVIGISIFTHLSEERHRFWISELYRVCKAQGMLLLTTAGQAFSSQMTDEEAASFNNNQLVIRDNVKEGHRTYAAFQPVEYFIGLCSPYFEVLEMHAGTPQSWGIEQDYWVLKAKK